MKTGGFSILCSLCAAFSIAGGAAGELPRVVPQVGYELSGGAGHYDYAPSFITDRYGIVYGYLCENRDPFEIVDYIYLYKGIPTAQGMKWQPGTEVIEPSRTGWDDCHICDPDVREFRTTWKGKDHKWIMTYLGVDQWDCNHNQIGIALSDNIEGPWEKFPAPVVPYEGRDRWGTGQSTSVVLNDSTIALFYHSTTENGPFAMRMVDLSDLDNIDIGREYAVPFLSANTYVAVSDNWIYTVSEERSENYEKIIPTWVGDLCVVRCKPRSGDLVADMTSPVNEWIEIGRVTPGLSGFPRNHNPGFLTDSRGWVPTEDSLTVYFTPAVTGDDWLWSYDLYSAVFDLGAFNRERDRKFKNRK